MSVARTSADVITLKLWYVASLCALPAFCVGLALASMNSCLSMGDSHDEKQCYDDLDDTCPPGTIYNDLQLDSLKAQIATALGILGAWIGALNGSQPAEYYGRRLTLLGNNSLFIIGGALTCSGDEYCLYIGRLMLGIGAGIGSAVCPVILSEISSPETLGAITSMNQLMITFAIFVIALVAYGFVMNVNHGWQYVQGFVFVPCLIMLVNFKVIPESPKWLLQRNRDQEARQIITSLRPDDYDVEYEINEIKFEIKQAQEVGGDSSGGSGSGDNEGGGGREVTWEDCWQAKHAMIVGIGLMAISGLTGVNTVIFYSTTIFGFAGFDEEILATASVGLTNFLFTFVGMYYTDIMGRKSLLLISVGIMLAALCLLALVLLLANDDDTIQGYIAVFSALAFVAGFSIGIGPIGWVVMSEMVPTRLRSKAFGLFLSVNWGTNLVIAMTTLTVIDAMGKVNNDMDDDEIAKREKSGVAYLYLVLAVNCILSLLFIQFVVPETKGRTPEQLLGMKAPLLLHLNDNDDDRLLDSRMRKGKS